MEKGSPKSYARLCRLHRHVPLYQPMHKPRTLQNQHLLALSATQITMLRALRNHVCADGISCYTAAAGPRHALPGPPPVLIPSVS